MFWRFLRIPGSHPHPPRPAGSNFGVQRDGYRHGQVIILQAFQGMEIVWVGWRIKPKTDQKYATMIIEVTDPVMGNNILEQNLVVSKQIRACSVFNKACRTIQCFKCYQYGHTTVQCSYEEKCGHCAGSHATQSNSCSEGFRVRCCLCHGAHKPWMKSCPKK